MTSELVVLVPSRARPQNIQRLLQAWTSTSAQASLVIYVDDDDPEIESYRALLSDPYTSLVIGPRRGLNATINWLATRLVDTYAYMGFMGDDHLPRTARWDQLIVAELEKLGTGIVYGNDLLQGGAIPTAVFMTSDIPRALGYFSPPELTHMYLDNSWLEWGRGINRIKYLPNVVIEHMHWSVGKAQHDASYGETGPLMGPDQVVFDQYMKERFADDLAKLKELL